MTRKYIVNKRLHAYFTSCLCISDGHDKKENRLSIRDPYLCTAPSDRSSESHPVCLSDTQTVPQSMLRVGSEQTSGQEWAKSYIKYDCSSVKGRTLTISSWWLSKCEMHACHSAKLNHTQQVFSLLVQLSQLYLTDIYNVIFACIYSWRTHCTVNR